MLKPPLWVSSLAEQCPDAAKQPLQRHGQGGAIDHAGAEPQGMAVEAARIWEDPPASRHAGMASRFVLWGTYCEDVLEKRAPFREEHLARLQQLKEGGSLLTLGPTTDLSRVFGIFEGDSSEAIEALVKADVYWREGIWTAIEIHPWTQAF